MFNRDHCHCDDLVTVRRVMGVFVQDAIDRRARLEHPDPPAELLDRIGDYLTLEQNAQLDAVSPDVRTLIDAVAYGMYCFGVDTGREIERMIVGDDHPEFHTPPADVVATPASQGGAQ